MKRDRRCVGSSLSFGGRAVVFNKVTAEVTWSGDCGRRGLGSPSAEWVLSIWSTAFHLLYPSIIRVFSWCLLKDDPGARSQLQEPDVLDYFSSTLWPHPEVLTFCPLVQDYIYTLGNFESSSENHDPC